MSTKARKTAARVPPAAAPRRAAKESAVGDVAAIVRRYRVRPEHIYMQDSLGYLLWLGGRNWNRHLEQSLRRVNLSHIQAGLLFATYLSHSEGRIPTQAHLASFTRYDPMLVSKALRGLEKRGYVKRRPQAASNRVTLTDKGGAILAEVSKIKTKAMREFFGRLGKDRKTLVRLLKSLLSR